MIDSDVELAIAAADEGARVVRSMFGSDLARVAKSPTDFATDADIEAERVILQLLRAARPADQLIGEESGASVDGGGSRAWLVDPLCGTLNYAARTQIAAVNVALRADGRIAAAVCIDPFSQEIFWTDGVQANVRSGGIDERLTPSSASSLIDVNLDGPYPNGDWFQTTRLLADPAFAALFRPRVTSTTLALTWVAAGRRSGYVTDGSLLNSVHFTSGIAICQAAGCVVTGLEGQPLHTGIEGLVVAADRSDHRALVAMVADQRSHAQPHQDVSRGRPSS